MTGQLVTLQLAMCVLLNIAYSVHKSFIKISVSHLYVSILDKLIVLSMKFGRELVQNLMNGRPRRYCGGPDKLVGGSLEG